MSATALLLPLLALVPPSPAAPDDEEAGRAPDEGWQLVDAVAVQAGDRVVTLGELDEVLRAEMEARDVTNPEERDVLTWNLIELLATARLEPQAGRDLGFDAEQISNHIRYQIGEDRRQAGPLGFGELLRESARTIAGYEESAEADIYRDLWLRTMVGYPSLPGARPIRDRFVRPGELRGIYRVYRDQLNPPTVQLQLLVSPVAAWGGREAALEGLADIRRRAEAGEDFDDLVQEFGSEGREDRGLTPPTLATRIPLPALREFALEAGEGDVGQPIEVERDGQPFLLLPRLVLRQAPPAEVYDEREVQEDLRRRVHEGRDGLILSSERTRLLRRSYSWVHPALGHLREKARAARDRGPAGS